MSFNPRARVGRDWKRCVGMFNKSVSIHAPAWGATGHRRGSGRAETFQSTRPRGARLYGSHGDQTYNLFQSTRPRGARLPLFIGGGNHVWFQSTRPRGARRRWLPGWFRPDWFQSTRPRGARLYGSHGDQTYNLFQSTRPRGARRGTGIRRPRGDDVSIHAPAWGATSVAPDKLQAARFQSTRPRGARPPVAR